MNLYMPCRFAGCQRFVKLPAKQPIMCKLHRRIEKLKTSNTTQKESK